MRLSALFGILAISCLAVYPQNKDANYDEAKVPTYTLPDPLVLRNGQPGQKRPHLERKAPAGIAGVVPRRNVRAPGRGSRYT